VVTGGEFSNGHPGETEIKESHHLTRHAIIITHFWLDRKWVKNIKKNWLQFHDYVVFIQAI